MVNQEMIQYLERLLPKKEEAIVAMERYAREHNVPIMDALSIETMLHMLKLVQPMRILEIGTAIGYSAIRMAKALPHVHIVTIERDEERYKQALVYVEQTNTKRASDVIVWRCARNGRRSEKSMLLLTYYLLTRQKDNIAAFLNCTSRY
ncbi:MAG: hypothetical protein KatS3mg080_0651 [Anoxybacillus sp.]|nr:MAG: hypothetical protein KatS3mg080_0651 [Anoxybacillus sp.]